MSQSDLTPVEQTGYVHAHMKDNGAVYRFTLADAEPLRAAWMAGQAFYTGASPYGGPTTIKLALVEGVVDWTREACERCEENSAADRARERHRRMVDGDA